MYWKALGATGQDAALYLEAAGGRANVRQSEGRLSFVATGYTGGTAKSAQMALVGRPDGKSVIYCEPAGGFFGIGEGGLLVGACGETTDVPAGEIWADAGFSSDAGTTVVKAGQNAAVAVKLTADWTTNARVLTDILAAGFGMPAGYYVICDAFSADPLWLGKVNISESSAASLGDIYFGGMYPRPVWCFG